MRRAAALTGVLAVLLLLVAGCGGAPAATERSASPGGIGRYVALGDSYTAAPGVPRPTGPATCFRSDRDYPALAAAALHPSAFVDRSCGGATTADMTKAQASGVTPQFDALTPQTDVVTVGIGGNDLNVFGILVGYCVQAAAGDPQGAPCTDALRKNPQRVQQALGTIRRNVTQVLRGVRERSPHATVLAVGYPQIVPAHGTCAAIPLATGDYPLGRRVNRGLDRAVRSAARTAGVGYVDIWSASAGHDICAADPWINGIHNAPGKAIPFHPFEAEQQAVARLVVRAVRQPH
ncbi:MAG: SGNH/GDSL hydrolase family protein [Marmoricola sp.]